MRQVREFQQLLAEKQQQGVDTSAAERLNLQSRQAAQSGNHQRAQELLMQALRQLRESASHPTAASPANDSPSAQPSPRQGQQIQGDRPPRPGPRGGERPEKRPRQQDQTRRTPNNGSAPVFVLPFAHHYNGPGGYYAPASEVRALAEFFHKYQLPGTMFFDGIHIERLKKEDPSVLNLVNEYKLAIGYHGEETHGPYPVPSDLFAEVYPLKEAQGYQGTWSLTTGKDWDAAVKAVQERYSHALPWVIDEKTRMIDRRTETPNHLPLVGGLKLVQETFGRDISFMPSHGLESAPVGFAFRKMSTFPLDQPAVPTALHALRIFKVGHVADQIMAIAGKDVSVFWFMGRLTNKGDDVGESSWVPKTLHDLERLDRSQPRLLLMGFSKFKKDAAAETVNGLNAFFAENPGSAWVSGETIMSHFEGEKTYHPTSEDLSQIAAALVRDWQGRPPDLVVTSDRVFSLADAFEYLCLAYANAGKTALPDNKTLYGPVLKDPRALLPTSEVISLAELSQAAEKIIASWQAQTDRFVPAQIQVGTRTLNCAEFLSALATGYAQRSQGDAGSVSVKPSTVFPPYADLLQSVFKPRATQPLCYTNGQLWTVKPARALPQNAKIDSSSRRQNRPAPPSATLPADAPTTATGIVRVVFAANIDSKGGCYREDPRGADLYSVEIDLQKKTASGLKRLTHQADSAEWFPALSGDGVWVAYNRTTMPEDRRQTRQEVRIIHLPTGKDTLLMEDARFPCFVDASRLCFSLRSQGKSRICIGDFTTGRDGTPALANVRVVADERHGAMLVEDPSVLADGKRMAFHRKQGRDGGAGLGLINLDGSAFSELTPPNGAGHAAASPDGRTISYTSSRDGRLYALQSNGGGFKDAQPLPISTTASNFQSCDGRFVQVPNVAHTYHEWLSPSLVLVSSQGSDGKRQFSFSRVLLFHFAEGLSKTPELIDVSSAIEKLLNKTGLDFCTADGAFVSSTP